METSYEINHKTIEGLRIADPHYAFKGMTYGQWAAVRWNHVFSAQPDINYAIEKGMVFLRGVFEYGYEDLPVPRPYSTQTTDRRLNILEDTAVFVPIISSVFPLDSEYKGAIMKDEISLRSEARIDTVYGGDLWARIRQKPDDTDHPLVQDLNYFFIESSLFPLKVHETNIHKDKMDVPIEAGNHYAVSVGIFVIISYLPPGTYRL